MAGVVFNGLCMNNIIGLVFWLSALLTRSAYLFQYPFQINQFKLYCNEKNCHLWERWYR